MSESGIELVDGAPEEPPEGAQTLPATMMMVQVGLDPRTGGAIILKDDKLVVSWELVVAILSVGLDVAKFHRNVSQGNQLQRQAMKDAEDQMLREHIAQQNKQALKGGRR